MGQTLFVMLVCIALAMLLLAYGIQSGDLMEKVAPWFPAIATAGSLLTAIALAWSKFRSNTLRVLGLRWPDAAQFVIVVLLVVPLSVLAQELAVVVDHWIPRESDSQTELLKLFATTGWFSIVIFGGLFPAVGEEIFFRGFLGRGLVAHYGVIGGVLLSSLAFGLMHFTPTHIAATFVCGLGFHATFLACKSLPAAMILHFLINCQALIRLSYQIQASDHPLPEAMQSTAFTWIVVVCSVLAVSLLGTLLYQLRTRWTFPPESSWYVAYATAETPPVTACATRDSIWQHRWLMTITLIVWIGFAVAYLRSGAFGS